MKNVFKMTAVAAVLSLSVAACTTQPGEREILGTVGGGALGAVVGSQFGSGDGQLAATALGAVIGAMIGRDLGVQLDYVARQRMTQATERAIAQNERIEWETPNARGYSRPIRDGRTSSGARCREVEMSVVVDGRLETAYTTACQGRDGRWEIVS